MGVQEIKSVKMTCDRCGYTEEHFNEGIAVGLGWDQVRVNNSDRRTHWLCPADARKHDLWLMGTKTGAGQRFNADEETRWEEAKR